MSTLSTTDKSLSNSQNNQLALVEKYIEKYQKDGQLGDCETETIRDCLYQHRVFNRRELTNKDKKELEIYDLYLQKVLNYKIKKGSFDLKYEDILNTVFYLVSRELSDVSISTNYPINIKLVDELFFPKGDSEDRNCPVDGLCDSGITGASIEIRKACLEELYFESNNRLNVNELFNLLVLFFHEIKHAHQEYSCYHDLYINFNIYTIIMEIFICEKNDDYVQENYSDLFREIDAEISANIEARDILKRYLPSVYEICQREIEARLCSLMYQYRNAFHRLPSSSPWTMEELGINTNNGLIIERALFDKYVKEYPGEIPLPYEFMSIEYDEAYNKKTKEHLIYDYRAKIHKIRIDSSFGIIDADEERNRLWRTKDLYKHLFTIGSKRWDYEEDITYIKRKNSI